MLSTIRNRLAGPSAAPSNDEAELLAQFTGENPDKLQRQLADLQGRREADEARWKALDPLHDQLAARERRAIEDRGPELDAQIKVLRSRIEVAEARRAAFVALVAILRAMDQRIVQEAHRLYAEFLLIGSKDERRTRLESLDGLVRSRARMAAPLAAVSPAREFRRAPDPLSALADDLRARADEIDRQRAPGMRRSFFALPDGAQELIAALNEGRSA